MVGQRVLLPLLVVAFALLGPGQALAAPQWRVPDPPLLPAGGAPDVTADGQGNSAAAWYSGGHIYVAQRPFGGPWASADDLQPDGQAAGQDPKIAALPDGELVVAWVLQTDDVQAASKPPGGDWSSPQTIGTDCCTELVDAVAGADGTALVFWNSGDGTAATAVKPPGASAFDPPQGLSLNLQPAKVALAPDGSAVAAAPGDCGIDVTAPCIRAQFRPAGGTWGTPELVSDTQAPPSGIGVAARPGSSAFTVAWGDSDGSVWSADREAGSWTTAIPVPGIVPGGGVPPAGCASGSFGCFDLAGRGDGLAAVWQAGTEVAGSVRSGGGGWSDRETVGSAGTAANTGDADTAVAIAADGTPITGWTAGSGGVGAVLRGAHRSGAGTWQQQELGTPSGGEAGLSLGDVAADGLGDGLAGFADPAGSQVAGFDGAGPRVSVSVPATGTAGQTLPFSAAADDNWSGIASISWLFGDGGTASGTSVGHAYGTAGTFMATATATDRVGNASQASGTTAVAAAPTPTPTPTPTPDPCGAGDRDLDGIGDACDKNDGSRKPVPFKTVNATVVSGEVFVKLPAGAARASRKAPKGFVRLQGAETIPVRSTLDTAHGRVLLRSASDTRNHVQIGQFYRGRFVVRQFRKPPSRRGRRSTKLITELRLTGSSFAKSCKTSAAKATASARRRSKKRVRRLFGDGKGAFRTKGRNAAATVRGTRWGVQDRCDGTLVTVQRGRVSVRDLVKRKTVLVKAGHTYLARRR